MTRYTELSDPSAACIATDAPVVSVVMPAWNCARYIRRAIDSVLAQTITDLELIIIDDGSTDDTTAAVGDYDDSRIRLLRSGCNRGPAWCRNLGMQAARGEWIALLDGDDWMLPDRLENLCNQGRQYGADAIADDLYIVRDGQDTPASTLFMEAGLTCEGHALLSAADMLAHEIGALKPVFRRALYSQHGHSYDETVRYGEDCLLYLSWLGAGKRMIVTRPAGYFLRRGDTGSLTSARLTMARASHALNLRLLALPSLNGPARTRNALRSRVARSRDLLVFYEVICPMRAGQFASAWTALCRSPRFLLVALRRAPAIAVLRLRRLAWQRTGPAPRTPHRVAEAREEAA